ncbi:PspA/IM30 family protein [Paenibacillus arenilitoris]|uniref:PspA/IM30 family protein n=1 Tax=Paenibacillus arenilitoris TaxID=2772299 RepID=A0A927CP64_9BACL|nr:PspA/IM30 family protein [Paenibacillus arenilitoris]MBD2870927.1 PspA/IM30 family protein [Paenibacillus arenilitoris]
MGILQRVVSMTKAAANEMLDKIENPVMMLNHYLRDLDEEIAKAEHALPQQQAQARMLEAKLDELKEQAAYYEGKAAQAASELREADARLALEAKLLYEEQVEEKTRLLQIASEAAAELAQRIETLKEEKTRLQSKRTELVARVRQSGGPAGNHSAHALNGSEASKGFERIEQKVMEWEAQRELSKSAYAPHDFGSDQQTERRNARVDEELKRLLNKQSVN